MTNSFELRCFDRISTANQQIQSYDLMTRGIKSGYERETGILPQEERGRQPTRGRQAVFQRKNKQSTRGNQEVYRAVYLREQGSVNEENNLSTRGRQLFYQRRKDRNFYKWETGSLPAEERIFHSTKTNEHCFKKILQQDAQI